MSIKFTLRDFQTKRALKRLRDVPNELADEAYDFFKRTTPIRTGNARRRTRLQGTNIKADYKYSGKLDDGYSNQAPDGMVGPTINFIKKRFPQLVKRKWK